MPSGPPTTTVQMPPAAPLPPGTRTLTLPAAGDWDPGINDLAVTADAVWVSGGVFGVDPATNIVRGPLTTFQSEDIATGEGSVWASGYDADVVRRIDPLTGAQLAVVRLPRGSSPEGIADAGGAIWVATHHGGTLVRIDPQRNRVAATVVLTRPGQAGPQGVAVGLGSIWVDVPNVNAVFRIDPATNEITAIIRFPPDMSACGGIAVGATAVWVTSCGDGTVVARIDPVTNMAVSILDVGGEVIQPAAEGDTVWFVAGQDPDYPPAPGYLIHLRADNSVGTRIALPTGFLSGGTAVAFGSVWLSDFAHPQLIRMPDQN